MNRQMLEQHLALAERHAAQGRRHIADQRRILAELARDGHDTTEARRLLANFEAIQTFHVQDRDRIAKELSDAKRSSAS